MSRIRLTIDALSLKGFDAADSRALVEGFKRELTRTLSDPVARAAWVRAQRTPVLRLGQIPIETGSAGSRKLGRAIAQGIGKGLKP
jgi:hypothetical protein